MKTKTTTSTDDLDWCYFDNCEKHHSPTGPPSRIQPTWGQLAEHRDKQAHWDSYQIPRVSNSIKTQIKELIDSSETTQDYIAAYDAARLAGMCYWSIKEGDWIWRK